MTQFAAAPFSARFLDGLPETAAELVQPTPVARPRLIAWNEGLARQFGLATPNEDDVRALGGNLIPPGARTYAARYGGHQFGHWAGQLGDGRAIGFGELRARDGVDWDVQLKGAGRTPFSRGADGRAVLRSSLREYVCSEAMHALNVPTTRALALVSTGDGVVRDMFYDGRPQTESGAIVCRISPSFLRFGNFEWFASRNDAAGVRGLLDFVLTNHYPELGASGRDAYVALFREVALRTADMISRWMALGFVHGVMNTDNMSILGLTIDYGPYGWLEDYDPNWTPNTTDLPGRRYCFGRQPAIGEWNLAQLGSAIATFDETLIPGLREGLKAYGEAFGRASTQATAGKLGLKSIADAEGRRLFTELDELMQISGADFTNLYRALGAGPTVDTLSATFYREPPAEVRARWAAWLAEYDARVTFEGADPAARRRQMDAVNPRYVPRNYLLQEAIDLANAGDVSRLHALVDTLTNPFVDQPGRDAFAGLRPEWARNRAGCSTLSCSS